MSIVSDSFLAEDLNTLNSPSPSILCIAIWEWGRCLKMCQFKPSQAENPIGSRGLLRFSRLCVDHPGPLLLFAGTPPPHSPRDCLRSALAVSCQSVFAVALQMCFCSDVRRENTQGTACESSMQTWVELHLNFRVCGLICFQQRSSGLIVLSWLMPCNQLEARVLE